MLPVVEVMDPIQKLGDKLGTQAQDPNATPKQVAQLLCHQMSEQLHNMVYAYLMKKNNAFCD